MNDQIKSVITCDLDGKVETFSDGASALLATAKKRLLVR
ncbi:hypothetical protein Ct9H90mP29_03050 [bacterium]|nr:MAG: hypothetical protein Ct9H90mP29_03050 [bacterium]